MCQTRPSSALEGGGTTMGAGVPMARSASALPGRFADAEPGSHRGDPGPNERDLPLGRGQALADRVLREVRDVPQVQLIHDLTSMAIDGRHGDVEDGGDLLR